MSLQLLPAEESDVTTFSKIIYKTFDDELMRLMYPQGVSRDCIDWYADKLRKELTSKGSNIRMNKIVDSAPPGGEIISIAKWHFYHTQRSEGELDEEQKESDLAGSPPGVNVEIMEAFHGAMATNRRKVWGGRPYVLLQVLATLPEHHRRGAGARHLQWGLAAADELHLPVWLEATPMGQPLYEKYGFKAIDDVGFDPQRWGLSESYRTVNMLRAARHAS